MTVPMVSGYILATVVKTAVLNAANPMASIIRTRKQLATKVTMSSIQYSSLNQKQCERLIKFKKYNHHITSQFKLVSTKSSSRFHALFYDCLTQSQCRRLQLLYLQRSTQLSVQIEAPDEVRWVWQVRYQVYVLLLNYNREGERKHRMSDLIVEYCNIVKGSSFRRLSMKSSYSSSKKCRSAIVSPSHLTILNSCVSKAQKLWNRFWHLVAVYWQTRFTYERTFNHLFTISSLSMPSSLYVVNACLIISRNFHSHLESYSRNVKMTLIVMIQFHDHIRTQPIISRSRQIFFDERN